MNRTLVMAAVAAGIVVAGAALWWWASEDDLSFSATNPASPTGQTVLTEPRTGEMLPDLTAQNIPGEMTTVGVVPGKDPLLPVVPIQVEDAAVSMAAAREHGDPMAPPIKHEADTREKASPEELADPDLYAKYEARQDRRLKQAYVKAAGPQLDQLEQDVAKARASGVDPKKIREGEEKIERLRAMREQLLQKDPGLAEEGM